MSAFAEDNASAETESSDRSVISETDISYEGEASESDSVEAEVSEPDPVLPVAGAYSEGYFEYNVDDGGVATLTKYTGTARNVDIPETLGGYPVAYIGNSAFYDNDRLVTVTIGSNIKKIDHYAFEYCNNLSEIVIPDSVTSLGYSVFKGCISLKKAVIGKGLKEIESGTFSGCTKLASVTIGPNVSTIKNNGFSNSGIEGTLYIPDSVKTIETSAFSGCAKITAISFGNDVQSIGISAFKNCDSLISVTLPDSVTKLGDDVFNSCDSLKKITFGSGLTGTGVETCAFCPSLTDIVLPSSITTIGNSSFYKCSGLTKLIIPDTVKYIGSSAFYSCTSLAYIDFGKGVTDIGGAAFQNCDAITDVIIPDTMLEMSSSNVFADCDNLKTIVFGKELADVGSSAVNSCDRLADVVIKEGVMEIRSSAFYNCKALRRIYIPSTINTIGSGSFGSLGNAKFSMSYGGSKTDWEDITKYSHFNSDMQNCTIYYDCPEPVTITSLQMSGSTPVLQWTASSGASVYCIYRSEALSGELTYLGKTTSKAFKDTTAVNGKTYYYHVMAYKDADSFSYSIPKNITVTAPVVSKPALPTGLTLTPGNGTITASWNAVSGATYYTVYTYSDGKYTKAGTPVSTKFNITGLTNGKKYGVLVLATNSAGSSAFTASDVKFATPVAPAKPALPTGLTLTPGNGTITASWNAVSGATYYTVYTYSDGKYTKAGTPVSTKFNITGLTNGKKYGVLVLATNSAGSSAFTKYDVKFATPNVKPALPTGLTLTPGNGYITASWNAVSGASYYTVYTYSDGKYTKAGTPVSTKFNITGLTNGKKYGVLVLATNSAGSSAFTKYDVKFATPNVKPALPTGLTLTPGNGYITATWKPVSGAAYYTVYTYSDGKYTKVGTPVSTKFNITGLTNGKKYGVLVLATNSAGNSTLTKYDVKFATPNA